MKTFVKFSKVLFYDIALGLLLLQLFLLFSPRIVLINADIGRHIKNGEIFFKEKRIVSTNYYSYTEEDRGVVNHHWGAGAIFYLLWKIVGFPGLSIAFSLGMLITFVFFFWGGVRSSSFPATYIFAVLAAPIIATRTEIRPEVFSYLFLGMFFILLEFYRSRKLPFSVLITALVFIQIIWVNTHIFFAMGIFLVGAYFVDEWINKKEPGRLRQIGILLTAVSVACLINPSGIGGALSPLTIFKEYGYMLAENQSVLFMKKRFPENFVFKHFIGVSVFFVLLLIGSMNRRNWRAGIYKVLMAVVFSMLAWKAIRCFPLFGFFVIPVGGYFLKEFLGRLPRWAAVSIKWGGLMVAVAIVCIGFIGKRNYYSPYRKLQLPAVVKGIEKSSCWACEIFKNPGKLAGLAPGMQGSAEFFRKMNIKGPIFNNYDIGGYLIFELFPQERVFVDNRPEAYSNDFFKKIYVPMQEDEAVWKAKDQEYGFNAIYFYRHDMTPWAQPFLIRRVRDPEWAPVFVDLYTIILLKRNQQNALLIQRFEIPQSAFAFTENR